MKRIFLALTILAMTLAVLSALNSTAARSRQQLRSDQTTWRAQTRELAAVQTEQAALAEKVRELKRKLGAGPVTAVLDPALAEFLASNDIQSASPEMQDKLLAGFGRGGNSSGGYVLVSKAALRAITLRPLKSFSNGQKLTDAVRGVLAITPQEQASIEAVFAQAFEPVAAWAKANVQREGPAGNMLVRYTIPADPAFEQASTEKLFSTINATIGEERGQLLREYFQHFRVDEDGTIGSRMNILEIHRLPGQPGLGYRAGWKWENSEAINTYPEPIKPNKFPAAFLLVFPGGWQEVAKREGFELPEEFSRAEGLR